MTEQPNEKFPIRTFCLETIRREMSLIRREVCLSSDESFLKKRFDKLNSNDSPITRQKYNVLFQ